MITFLIGVALGFMLAVLNFIWLFFEKKAENKRNTNKQNKEL
jgi:hypothetical protein